MERNGDIVEMTSYAPLLAKEGYTQWNPDLIYFNNSEVKPTVGYYVQKLFGHHSGNEYLPSGISFSDNREDIKKRIATSFVMDKKTNELIIKIANLLPVPVSSFIDLSEMNITKEETAIMTVIKGNLDDRTVKPEEFTLSVQEDFNPELPAYSFSVIRIKTNNNSSN